MLMPELLTVATGWGIAPCALLDRCWLIHQFFIVKHVIPFSVGGTVRYRQKSIFDRFVLTARWISLLKSPSSGHHIRVALH